jgi:hypothetical protein
MRLDYRRRTEPDPFLDWKVRIFFVGAVLLMAAIIFGKDVLALVAAVILGVGAVLAGITRMRSSRGSRDGEDFSE